MNTQLITRRLFVALLGPAACGLGVIDAFVSLDNTIRPRGVVIHHSALSRDEGLADIEKLHSSRGFGIFYWWRIYRIGYHYIITADGSVHPIRPEHLRGAHARGGNDMIGICILGNFDSSSGSAVPTVTQMQSTKLLCKTILRRYGFSARDIHKHSELDTYTVCPGDHFPFEDVRRAMMNLSDQGHA
jgi:hypothetical protein